jgi:heme A synthase
MPGPQPPYPGPSGESPPYPGPPPGHPAYTEVVEASPRANSWIVLVPLVVSGLLAGMASIGEAVLAQRAWNDCDVGVNSLSMLVVGLPCC